jgi:hypothetical protein
MSGVREVVQKGIWDGGGHDGGGDDFEVDGRIVNDDGGAEVVDGASNEEGMLELGNPVDAGLAGHDDEGAEEVVRDGSMSHERDLTKGCPDSVRRRDRDSREEILESG